MDSSQVLNCIVAVTDSMGIGREGRLPWPPLKGDLRHFQRLTTASSSDSRQNVVIMGRRTWFSLPTKSRPLRNRINVVLSKRLTEPPEGAHFVACSLDMALKNLMSPGLSEKVGLVWVIGGRDVYAETISLPYCVRIFVTRVMGYFECDVFFPLENFKMLKHIPDFPGIPSNLHEDNGVKYKFEVYEKASCL
ncbi:dihydrofolate reductase [Rhinolophus gammaherpesvirus 1]|uniref:Viral dihydrofolate reductase n=1 Tax=Rhinolophus gammaherpesvirus 1 TaxID=2054179 RepID=A0A2Z5U771_9GAMA|nr:dihydrofolate reductase [Rhinolophus gammaherpesvirus 1]BBB06501.1 dihydrofolate reductase [Rhinolophus gammaherpesvirus 1]